LSSRPSSIGETGVAELTSVDCDDSTLPRGNAMVSEEVVENKSEKKASGTGKRKV
jgi:hypothetical protein